MCSVSLDVMNAVFPFEGVGLSTDELGATLEDESVILDLGDFFYDPDLLDDLEVDASPVLNLGDLFCEQEDTAQATVFEGANEIESGVRTKSCSGFCHSRMADFGDTILGDGPLCAVKCLAIDEREEQRLERLLEVLDRLVDSQDSDSPGTVCGPSEELTKTNSGSEFLQEIFDIFCEDDKVHVIHGFHERGLSDLFVEAWFSLPILTASSPGSIFHLDPDGTFFRHHEERTRQDVLFSLKILAAELTLGLLFLHERGIVHLGLTPSNILVTPSGHIQISDFGSANVLPKLLPGLVDLSDVGCSPATVRMTSSEFGASVVSLMALVSEFGEREEVDFGRFGSLALGSDEAVETGRYSAPELLERDEQGRLILDEKADWWSLGVVLWELAHGEEDPGCEQQGEGEDGGLRDFTCQLTRGHDERLAGAEVSRHEFLAFKPVVWREILDMKYPPCPALGSTLPPPHEDKNETDAISVYSAVSPIVADEPLEPILVPIIGPKSEYTLDATFVDEETHSDIQPFPSTASLYRDIRVQPIQEEDEEDVEVSHVLKVTQDATDDSGFAFNDPDIDDDGSPILIRAPSRQDMDLSFKPQFNLLCNEHEFELEKQRVDMNLDEMVALSLLRAKSGGGISGPQTRAVVNLQRSSTGIKRRLHKVRCISKASRRAVKLVSRFIFGVLRCR